MTQYIAYLRVSTSKQEKSGLGLAAQRSSIEEFLSDDDEMIAEFVETRSGRKDERNELWNAIRTAKRHSAKLLIAKLDRFSRKVSFISKIMDEGIGLVVAEMPTATDFQLHIFAALAQEERRLISERTKAALAIAKRRGVELGRNGKLLAAKHRAAADLHAESLRSIVLPMIESGMSFSAIANEMNCKGFPTARGGRYHPQTVANLYDRLKKPPCIDTGA